MIPIPEIDDMRRDETIDPRLADAIERIAGGGGLVTQELDLLQTRQQLPDVSSYASPAQAFAASGFTAGRVIFVGPTGELDEDPGLTYDAANDELVVGDQVRVGGATEARVVVDRNGYTDISASVAPLIELYRDDDLLKSFWRHDRIAIIPGNNSTAGAQFRVAKDDDLGQVGVVLGYNEGGQAFLQAGSGGSAETLYIGTGNILSGLQPGTPQIALLAHNGASNSTPAEVIIRGTTRDVGGSDVFVTIFDNVTLVQDTSFASTIYFKDGVSGSTFGGQIRYNHSTEALELVSLASGTPNNTINLLVRNSGGTTRTIQMHQDGHWVAQTDDAQDLGLVTLEWRNLYLDGTAFIDTADIDDLTVNNSFTFTGAVDLGMMGTSPAMRIPDVATKGAVRLLPEGITDTSAPTDFGLLTWDSTYTTDYVNNRFGGMIYATGTYVLEQNGFAFNTMNLFNLQSTIKNANGVALSIGPIFTLLHHPTIQADGAAVTHTQNRGLSAFVTYDTINGGTLTATNHWGALFGSTVNAGATVTDMDHIGILDATGAGTVTNQIGIDISNLTAGGTNIGIRSVQSSGTFIQLTGAAISTFAGDLHMNDGVSLVLGSTGSSRVELLRPFAGAIRMIGVGGTNNEGLDWDFDNANNVAITSSTSAGINFDVVEIAFGPSTVADGTNNWVFAFSPGLRGTQLAGDYSEVLFTSSSAITVAHAITNFATWTVNAPSVSIGGGSITNAANVLIQTSMSVGTNRYGLLITSNPSGGTLNYALRCTAGDARFDGRVDINNPIALGGGAAATLGTIGGSGPTAAAQAQWVEIDIGTVPHWIPVWT